MTLEKSFQKAGLTLKEMDKSLMGGSLNVDIFQIDIRRKVKGIARTEYFRIHKGAASNIVNVLSVDPQLKQLVLLVKEASRSFENSRVKQRGDDEELGENGIPNWALKSAAGNKILKWTDRRVTFIDHTSEETRRFLLGVDERQLFIAQLDSPVTTVDEARKSLGRTVQFAEGKYNTSRQGEWFFIETNKDQREEIERLLGKKEVVIFEKVAIGERAGRRGGKPHIAEELISFPAEKLEHGFPVRGNDIYVRGAIRHADHKTITFRNWRRVVANNEHPATSSGSSRGVNWID